MKNLKEQLWTVHKFGGSSLASHEKIFNMANIVKGIHSDRSAVVVSAMGGMTDRFIELTKLSANKDSQVKTKLKSIQDDFSKTCESLLSCLLYTSPSPRDGLLSRMPSSA